MCACRLWATLFGKMLLPEIRKIGRKERKVAVVGLTRLLTEGRAMREGANGELWCVRSCGRAAGWLTCGQGRML